MELKQKILASEDFNYITKKVRVATPAEDSPTGPPLHFYQILSNYLKQYWIYCLHKISALGEINT